MQLIINKNDITLNVKTYKILREKVAKFVHIDTQEVFDDDSH